MKSCLILFLFIIILNSCGSKQESGNNIAGNSQRFELRKQDYNELRDPVDAWATNYYIPEFRDGSGEIALRDMNGNALGPRLSSHDWCSSALEGSVKINFENGISKVYNFLGKAEKFSVDCSAFLGLDIGQSKFKISKSEFGEGTAAYNLVPFRSLATDNDVFPLGTVLYIPAARGNKIKVGDKYIIHDGYFFVADRGGAIKENHIDVFTGVKHSSTFFPWIGHNSESVFKAYIVTDPKIIENLSNQHLKKNN